MRNKENIKRVRDAIVAHPKNFNMDLWLHGAFEANLLREGKNCNTVACIGGWTQLLFTDDDTSNDFYTDDVAKVFGINNRDAYRLCYPLPISGRSCYSATAEQAARVLDHLIETGEVNWNKAFDD